MCDRCGVDHDEDVGFEHVPEAIRDKFEDVYNRLHHLTDEQRNLFIDEAVMKVKTMLTRITEAEHPIEMKTLAALADNSLNLVGMVNAISSDEHEDWTSTGDKVVGGVWNDWIVMTQSMVNATTVQAEDVPEDLRERFAKGEATDEDKAALKAIIAAKTGEEIPDEVEIEFGGVIGKPPEKEPAESKGGYGLYL